MNGFRTYVQFGKPVENEVIIDAHAHTGNLRLYIPDNGPDGLIRSMDRCGISLSVVSTMLAITADSPAGNDEAMEMQQATPHRIRGYAVVNPRMPERSCNVMNAVSVSGAIVPLPQYTSNAQPSLNARILPEP